MPRTTSLIPGQTPPAVTMPAVVREGSKYRNSLGPARSKAPPGSGPEPPANATPSRTRASSDTKPEEPPRGEDTRRVPRERTGARVDMEELSNSQTAQGGAAPCR